MLRPDIGEFGTLDLHFDVCSDNEYDSYVTIIIFDVCIAR